LGHVLGSFLTKQFGGEQKDDLVGTADRLTMCELACSTSDWLSVDGWEASSFFLFVIHGPSSF